ncbi:amidase [Sinorhizobium sp. BG8]|uniref:amidase n=1 Tax=Sinorhizobium sp. BG8 TaxID=2613773 RepID=UPI00193E041A|nr:amidase [Sinorhizobium sp. BG8]QRM57419.1 amidase [Sinorhizobium sp. BG8]
MSRMEQPRQSPVVSAAGDATSLAAAIAAGSLSCAEAMEAALEAAEQRRAEGAICHMDAEAGRAAARGMDAAQLSDPEGFSRRRFAGVPTLAKDLGGPFAGYPVVAGSRALEGRVDGSADSDLAVRFRKAGFCLFGVTTSPEFGLSLSSEPMRGPVCRNPLALDRTAGGSSGGAAAAVASGIVAIAHATDAGGSIRVPAACCGLVGLKPTRGLIPGGPAFGNHLGGIASELAVCRSVRDAEAILGAIAGKVRGPFADPQTDEVGPGSLRIGVLEDTGVLYPTDGERFHAVAEAARSLEAAGHTLIPLKWEALEHAVNMSQRAFADIVAVNLANLATSADLDLEKVEPMSRAFVERGAALAGTTLWETLNQGVLVSAALWSLFDTVDCILAPMLSCAPPPIGSFPSDHGDTDLHLQRMARFSPTAALANVSGFPAITLPFGRDDEGLPLPVQLIGPMGQDALLLSLAARLEGEGRWTHAFPVAGFGA